jgi:hypothetical protein
LPEIITLDLPRFAQAAPDLGGAASAQMLLGSADSDQKALALEAHKLGSDEPGWKLAPDSLPKLLNAHGKGGFAFHPDITADQALRRVAWSILKDRIAPAVLVWKCRHWALVTGFEADALPRAIDDDAWGPRGVYLRNPFGPTDHHVDVRSWKAQYQTGVLHGLWRTRRVVVCAGEAAAAAPALRPERDPDFVRREILGPDAIARAAAAAIAGDRFARHPDWRAAAEGAVPGEPMLVSRLNLPSDHAYIVPMLRTGRPTLLLMLDAYDGSYRESTPVAGEWPASLSEARARLGAMVASGAIAIEGEKEPVQLWPESTSVFPTLVWRPCLESLSPYLPFFQVNAGNRMIHVRLDGKVFGELSIRFSGA